MIMIFIIQFLDTEGGKKIKIILINGCFSSGKLKFA
jgi:hypothetical protein